MSYVIDKAEEKLIDAIAAPAAWSGRDPIYGVMFDQIAEHRSHEEKGTTIKKPEWSRIASMPSTMLDVIKAMSPDGVHLDRKQFYGFLKRNPQYLMRDERFGKAPDHGTP